MPQGTPRGGGGQLTEGSLKEGWLGRAAGTLTGTCACSHCCQHLLQLPALQLLLTPSPPLLLLLLVCCHLMLDVLGTQSFCCCGSITWSWATHSLQ